MSIPRATSLPPRFFPPAPANILPTRPWKPPTAGTSPRPKWRATPFPPTGSSVSSSPLPSPKHTPPPLVRKGNLSFLGVGAFSSDITLAGPTGFNPLGDVVRSRPLFRRVSLRRDPIPLQHPG